jgi:hypothetical protein
MRQLKTHPLVVRRLANRVVRGNGILGVRTGREENLVLRDGWISTGLPCGDVVLSKGEEASVVQAGGPALRLRLVSVKGTDV